MLIISRRIGESIYIDGQRIKLMVVDVCGHQVKLGIDAPPSVNILRSELLHRDPPFVRHDEVCDQCGGTGKADAADLVPPDGWCGGEA